jgi:hypothetical protein
MSDERNSQVDGDIAYSVPWIRDTLDGASAMIASGVNVEIVIFMVVLVPILMRSLQLAGMYVRTHNIDLRETIRLESMRQRLALRREYGAIYDEEAVSDSRLSLEIDRETDRK